MLERQLLIDRARIHANNWLEPFKPVLEEGSYGYIDDRLNEREQAGELVDPLAERCAAEVLQLLDGDEPDIFAAYVALEVAAAREPEVYGPVHRLFREFVMRSILGAARGSGIEANVSETTVRHQWVGRGKDRWRAQLVDGRLWISTSDGQRKILDPELGMLEDYDA